MKTRNLTRQLLAWGAPQRLVSCMRFSDWACPMTQGSVVRRYGMGLLCCAAAITCRWLIDPVVGHYLPLATIYPFVAMTVWYGGWGPAVLTTVVSYLTADWLFVGSPSAFEFGPAEAWGAGMYVVSCLLLIAIGQGMRCAQAHAVRNAALAFQAKERLRLAMVSANMGAWDLDLQQGTLLWDARQHEIFGQTFNDIPKTREEFYRLIHPLDVDRIKAAGAAALQNGRFSEEFRIVRADGHLRWIAGHGSILQDAAGRPVRMVGVNYDITARKETDACLQSLTQDLEREVTERTRELVDSQQQLRALATELNLTEQRERKRLATSLHDHLAQLLVLCSMKLNQLKRLVASDKRGTDLLKQADGILEEALRYTRTLVTELAPPVLYDLGLPAALQWLSRDMKRHDMAVTVVAPEDEPMIVPEEQAVFLFQSVRELVMNSCKHGGSGEATITMTKHSGSVEITVHDQGKGFDPTRKQDTITKFGLLSVQERMHTMGGLFRVQSSPGQGTTATLVLPLSACDLSSPNRPSQAGTCEASPRPEPSCPGVERHRAGSIRVLLVDDHAMMRQGLRSLLASYADIEIVAEASDGIEALCMVGQLRPAAVVMDINMPNMDGIEATTRIKARYPEIQVIGLSVNAGHENQEAMRKAGASILLTKEAAVEQLYGTIHDVVHPAPANSRHTDTSVPLVAPESVSARNC